MITSPIEKRRAERFAQLLDESQGGVRSHAQSAHDETLAPLVATGQALTSSMEEMTRATAPDPRFAADLRQRLMAVAAVQGIGATATSNGKSADRETATVPATVTDDAATARAPRGTRRLVIIIALMTGVLALSGVSAASGDALPGDALYNIKRSTERAQLALAGSDVNRGQLYLEFARTRLSEAGQITDRPDSLADTLSDMDGQTAEGMSLLGAAAWDRRDAAVLDAVDVFVDQQRQPLVELIGELSGEPREQAVESLALLEEVADRSERLRTGMLSSDTGEVTYDHLGPLPVSTTLADGGTTGGVSEVPGYEVTDPQASRSTDPRDDATTPSTEESPGACEQDPPDASESPDDSPSESPQDDLTDDLAEEVDDELDDTEETADGLLGVIGNMLTGLLGGGK